jgi:selenocysteine lyase/cysteine desulfurase
MIYLDNAATSFPKPKSVIREVERCISKYCGNPGRSAHKMSGYTAEMVYNSREAVSDLLHAENPENIVFTLNATYAINLALKAEITDGASVLISDIEHNAVLRPLYALSRERNIEISSFESGGELEKSIEEHISPKTRFIVTTLRSNVTGGDIDLSVLKNAAKRHKLTLILDASQYIGHKEINLSGIDSYALCAPTHKGLFGIQGGGFACFSDNTRKRCIIEGGTGSLSKSAEMPLNLPEGYEAGTLPTPAIISCLFGIKYINEIGIENIERKLKHLTDILAERLDCVSGVKVYGRENGIVSFAYRDISSEKISEYLASRGIYTRGGLHCAPSVHKKLGTDSLGLCRLSLSHFNTEREINAVYSALKDL